MNIVASKGHEVRVARDGVEKMPKRLVMPAIVGTAAVVVPAAVPIAAEMLLVIVVVVTDAVRILIIRLFLGRRVKHDAVLHRQFAGCWGGKRKAGRRYKAKKHERSADKVTATVQYRYAGKAEC